MQSSVFKRLGRKLVSALFTVAATVAAWVITTYLMPVIVDAWKDNRPPADVKTTQKQLDSYVRAQMHRHHFTGMPSVEIELADTLADPMQQESHYIAGARTIQIKRSFAANSSQEKLKKLVEHEMVHAWCDWKGFPNEQHGNMWLCKAREVGVEYRKYKRPEGNLICPDPPKRGAR